MDYERFADIYGIWTATASSARANLAFYVDAYLAADGPVVELGVGDGRIAVDAAVRGRAIIGVDLSPAMLRLCEERAERAGVIGRLTLLQADFRSFTLAEPAALIALPYHSIGHLSSLDEKRDALRHIHAQLRPGGCFMFDDFLMTPERLERMQSVQLRAEYQSADGRDVLLWVTSLVNEAAQSTGDPDAAAAAQHAQILRDDDLQLPHDGRGLSRRGAEWVESVVLRIGPKSKIEFHWLSGYPKSGNSLGDA